VDAAPLAHTWPTLRRAPAGRLVLPGCVSARQRGAGAVSELDDFHLYPMIAEPLRQAEAENFGVESDRNHESRTRIEGLNA